MSLGGWAWVEKPGWRSLGGEELTGEHCSLSAGCNAVSLCLERGDHFPGKVDWQIHATHISLWIWINAQIQIIPFRWDEEEKSWWELIGGERNMKLLWKWVGKNLKLLKRAAIEGPYSQQAPKLWSYASLKLRPTNWPRVKWRATSAAKIGMKILGSSSDSLVEHFCLIYLAQWDNLCNWHEWPSALEYSRHMKCCRHLKCLRKKLCLCLYYGNGWSSAGL